MKKFDELKNRIEKEKKISNEIALLVRDLERTKGPNEKNMISSHIDSLKKSLKQSNNEIGENLSEISLAKPLKQTILKKPVLESRENIELEKGAIKRMREKEKIEVEIEPKKPSMYVMIANKLFSRQSHEMVKGADFDSFKRDLIKANLQFLPVSYVSVILFTTLLSFVLGIIIFIFFLFFNVGVELPIVTRSSEALSSRFLKTFWVLLILPMITFLFTYFYPSLEKKSSEHKIDAEMPFVTIHMAAISGSMVNPSKIFEIVLTTDEYPEVSKEFRKLINEINIHGYDLISALRRSAFNSPSRKLAELFNGLATTINSGGDLPDFFEKRAQTLLFEHRIEREKQTRAAETFMDIYISVVIAAPMIFMLLLMMMKISGLGISLSTGAITLLMILGVAVVNIVFLVFLHLEQP